MRVLASSSGRIAASAAVLLLALALPACGDDEESTTSSEESAAVPDLERYCELSLELDAAGEETFAELENDPDATRADFEQAEQELIEDNAANLDEIQSVAPDEIQADVETLIAGLQVRAGLASEGPPEEEAASAEERLDEFETANCG